MKTAILFDNFGPYHLARMTAASEVMAVLAVEFAGSSHEYIWEREESAQTLQKTTLFPSLSSRQVSKKDFRRQLYKTLREFQPDAVAIPGWSGRGAFLALEWCLKNRVPAIVMSESTAYDEARASWREFIKKRYVSLCAAALVGGDPHRDYMTRLGMTSEQIFQGYDAVDNAYFAKYSDTARLDDRKLRIAHQLPAKYFLASARFIAKKNLGRLIAAYAKYREKRGAASAWDLVLLGDGELRPALESQISTLNLQPYIHLPGFKQYLELPTYYGLAGAFIHASISEQWGLVVNEAMACALPVLVSDRCGCAPDLVKDGVNGHTFAPEKMEQMTNLMLEVSDADFPISTFGSASRKIISQWAPTRFAGGLLAATQFATGKPAIPNHLSDRLLLNLLASR